MPALPAALPAAPSDLPEWHMPGNNIWGQLIKPENYKNRGESQLKFTELSFTTN